MKSPEGGENPWEWWQPLRLRLEARRRMNPMTPDTANRRRFIIAMIYCLTAVGYFHGVAYYAGAFSAKYSEQDVALEHTNEAKIISMENFKIKKIVDFSSADFDDEIKKTNKPSPILE